MAEQQEQQRDPLWAELHQLEAAGAFDRVSKMAQRIMAHVNADNLDSIDALLFAATVLAIYKRRTPGELAFHADQLIRILYNRKIEFVEQQMPDPDAGAE